MSNLKAVLITIISFVISAFIVNALGLSDTPMVVVSVILWIGVGLTISWFHDEIPLLKNIR